MSNDMKTLDGQTLTLGGVILQNLPKIPGVTMQYWIDTKNRPELKRVLEGLRIFPSNFGEPVVVALKKMEQFRKSLAATKHRLSGRFERMIPKIAFEQFPVGPESIFSVVTPSLEELGIENSSDLDEVIARGRQFGFGI